MKLQLAILQTAALVVPRQQRAEWLAEWRSELWYVRRASSHCKRGVTAYCLGAFKDAFFLRRTKPRLSVREILRLESPFHCTAFLAALAAVGALSAVQIPSGGNEQSMLMQRPLARLLMLVVFACLILPSTTSLSLGEYPANRDSSWPIRLRRWIFLLTKIGLILLIVYCQLLFLADPGTSGLAANLRIQGLLWGSIYAFRWALSDQRKRCPVCLRLLTNPAQIGQPAHNFLEWSGTELICARGHGLLHVPETPTSWFDTQRWLYLHPSWRDIF